MKWFGRRSGLEMAQPSRPAEQAAQQPAQQEAEQFVRPAEQAAGQPAQQSAQQVAQQPIEQLEQQRQNAERQQRKIIAGRLYGVERALAHHNVTLGKEDKEQYLQELRLDMAAEKATQGRAGSPAEREFLENIESPLNTHSIRSVFETKMQGDKHQMRILAQMSGLGFSQYERVSARDLGVFAASYQLPMDFDAVSEEFLRGIKAANGEQKYQEYVAAMNQFKQSIYGKRQEYWEQMKNLRREAQDAAETKVPTNNAVLAGGQVVAQKLRMAPERLNKPVPERLDKQAPERLDSQGQLISQERAYGRGQLRKPAPEQLYQWQGIKKAPERLDRRYDEIAPKGFTELSRWEQRRYLKKGRLEGSDWEQDGQRYYLTKERLVDLGLAPKYQMQVDGTKIGLSSAFPVEDRLAVIGYVEDMRGDVHIRSFYQSNSQGMWRYLPDFVEDDGQLTYYGKTENEEKVNLPAEMQAGLAWVAKKDTKEIDGHPGFVMTGTAKRYESKDAYRGAIFGGTATGALYDEVAHRPEVNFGVVNRYKATPEKVQLNEAQSPNFEDMVTCWRMRTSRAGEVNAKTFRSRDGKLKYTFCEDDRGRAWVAMIETNAPITSTGVRKEWASGGDLVTPLYEYREMSDGYGDESDADRDYVSMWPHYLSKMPVIQEYLAAEKA